MQLQKCMEIGYMALKKKKKLTFLFEDFDYLFCIKHITRILCGFSQTTRGEGKARAGKIPAPICAPRSLPHPRRWQESSGHTQR